MPAPRYGVLAGLACLVVGLHLADHGALADDGTATQGTAMAFFGAAAAAGCLLLIAAILIVNGAGRAWQWLRRPRTRTPGGN